MILADEAAPVATALHDHVRPVAADIRQDMDLTVPVSRDDQLFADNLGCEKVSRLRDLANMAEAYPLLVE